MYMAYFAGKPYTDKKVMGERYMDRKKKKKKGGGGGGNVDAKDTAFQVSKFQTIPKSQTFLFLNRPIKPQDRSVQLA